MARRVLANAGQSHLADKVIASVRSYISDDGRPGAEEEAADGEWKEVLRSFRRQYVAGRGNPHFAVMLGHMRRLPWPMSDLADGWAVKADLKA